MAKTPRKCLAHYVDAEFDASYEATDYQLIGADLTTFNVALNPQIDTTTNILGQTSVIHRGYQPTSAVDTFYHDAKKALEAKIIELAMSRKFDGDACKTSYVEVLYQEGETEDAEPTPIRAYREDIVCAITNYGGDTSGVQSPFDIHYAGNRVKGTFDRKTRKFTADGNGL